MLEVPSTEVSPIPFNRQTLPDTDVSRLKMTTRILNLISGWLVASEVNRWAAKLMILCTRDKSLRV